MMRNSRAVNLAMKEISFVPDEVFKDALSADVHIVDISKNKLLEVPSGYAYNKKYIMKQSQNKFLIL